MVGKPITGRSFGGCVRYLVNRQEAHILDAEGVRVQSSRSITQDFDMQRKMNPALGKAVGHTILSWSVEDSGRLTDESMADVAREYMEVMGIRNTQYLIVKHTDRAHPHLHIVYNRVNNEGKTITDRNNYRRNVEACKALTLKYGYHISEGKKAVNRQRLKGADRMKYAIHDAIKVALKTCKNWQELEHELKQSGIAIRYKYKGKTDEVQGISFEMDGVKFKGSAIDRSMGFAGIERQMRHNATLGQTPKTAREHALSQRGKINKDIPANGKNHPETAAGNAAMTALDIFEKLTESKPEDYYYDPVEQAYKKMKKKKRRRKKI